MPDDDLVWDVTGYLRGDVFALNKLLALGRAPRDDRDLLYVRLVLRYPHSVAMVNSALNTWLDKSLGWAPDPVGVQLLEFTSVHIIYLHPATLFEVLQQPPII